MSRKYYTIAAIALALAISATPDVAHATLRVSTFGFGTLTFADIVINLGRHFTRAMTMVATAIFTIGAFFMAFSAGDEEKKSLGKSLMIGALIGTAIVYGATGIFNTVLYIAYGT